MREKECDISTNRKAPTKRHSQSASRPARCIIILSNHERQPHQILGFRTDENGWPAGYCPCVAAGIVSPALSKIVQILIFSSADVGNAIYLRDKHDHELVNIKGSGCAFKYKWLPIHAMESCFKIWQIPKGIAC